jgi:hypothetical protein
VALRDFHQSGTRTLKPCFFHDRDVVQKWIRLRNCPRLWLKDRTGTQHLSHNFASIRRFAHGNQQFSQLRLVTLRCILSQRFAQRQMLHLRLCRNAMRVRGEKRKRSIGITFILCQDEM